MYNEVSASPIRLFFHQKWVRIVLVLDFLAIIAVIGVAIFNSTKTSIVSFYVTPRDAIINVSGTTYENGTYKFSPGSYDVVISHKDLNSKKFHLNLEPDSSMNVTTFLSATDDDGEESFAFYEQASNYDSFQILANIASSNENRTSDHDTSAEDFITKMNHKISLFSKLPILGYVYADPSVNGPTAGFSIRNGTGNEKCTKIACLLVMNYGEGFKDSVAEKINEAGYDPADYEIVYERYKK